MKSAPPAPTSIIGFPGAAVGAIPFVFPFAPLGLGLFETDPQRLLAMLQHQSALAEEALRYRSLLLDGGAGGSFGGPAATGAVGLPSAEDCKQDHSLELNHHQHAHRPVTAVKSSSTATATIIRVRDGLTKESFRSRMADEELLLQKPPNLAPASGVSAESTRLRASSSAELFPAIAASSAEKAPPVPLADPDNTKCHICMANFPSAWLLEQHSALQHPHLTIHDDKPYHCGLCGQRSRYACCRYRTVLSKPGQRSAELGGTVDACGGAGAGGLAGGRSRVPADKLFTCDVCGMQFRYLKSFKKHRLNHALERLHGKKGTVGVPGGCGLTSSPRPSHGPDSEPAVSSTNAESEGSSGVVVADLRGLLEGGGGGGRGASEEQDDTVSDSVPVTTTAAGQTDDTQPKITSSSSSSGSSHNSEGSSSGSNSPINSTTTTTSTTTSTTSTMVQLPSVGCQGFASTGSGSSSGTALQVVDCSEVLLPPPSTVNSEQLKQRLPHQHEHQHGSIGLSVRSMEAESSSAHHHHHHHQHHHQQQQQQQQQQESLSHTLNSLINAETIPHHRLLGLDPQEASILNFLRVDAAEKQRDRRFACPFCGKCVRSKENLKLHVRKHTGERPFVCLFCGRAFGGKSDLTRHLRIHTGERPYHCEACGKCFARADYLSKHLTTHVHQMSPRP